MPGPGRVMKSVMDFFPGFGPAMTRMSGAERTISQVADHREAEAAKLAHS
jgi:hypothetical protein